MKCCQEGGGSTGSTLKGVLDFVRVRQPAFGLLENVSDIILHRTFLEKDLVCFVALTSNQDLKHLAAPEVFCRLCSSHAPFIAARCRSLRSLGTPFPSWILTRPVWVFQFVGLGGTSRLSGAAGQKRPSLGKCVDATTLLLFRCTQSRRQQQQTAKARKKRARNR